MARPSILGIGQERNREVSQHSGFDGRSRAVQMPTRGRRVMEEGAGAQTQSTHATVVARRITDLRGGVESGVRNTEYWRRIFGYVDRCVIVTEAKIRAESMRHLFGRVESAGWTIGNQHDCSLCKERVSEQSKWLHQHLLLILGRTAVQSPHVLLVTVPGSSRLFRWT